MEQINDLHEVLPEKYGEQVRVDSYNLYYDDTYEIRSIIEEIRLTAVMLPAVFINGELKLGGYIDEPTINQALLELGLSPVRRKSNR